MKSVQNFTLKWVVICEAIQICGCFSGEVWIQIDVLGCFFVLRSLPPLAKKYVLQMLYIDVPVTAKTMEEWVLADGVSKHRVAIDRLIQLRVFTETSDR